MFQIKMYLLRSPALQSEEPAARSETEEPAGVGPKFNPWLGGPLYGEKLWGGAWTPQHGFRWFGFPPEIKPPKD